MSELQYEVDASRVTQFKMRKEAIGGLFLYLAERALQADAAVAEPHHPAVKPDQLKVIPYIIFGGVHYTLETSVELAGGGRMLLADHTVEAAMTEVAGRRVTSVIESDSRQVLAPDVGPKYGSTFMSINAGFAADAKGQDPFNCGITF